MEIFKSDFDQNWAFLSITYFDISTLEKHAYFTKTTWESFYLGYFPTLAWCLQADDTLGKGSSFTNAAVSAVSLHKHYSLQPCTPSDFSLIISTSFWIVMQDRVTDISLINSVYNQVDTSSQNVCNTSAPSNNHQNREECQWHTVQITVKFKGV